MGLVCQTISSWTLNSHDLENPAALKTHYCLQLHITSYRHEWHRTIPLKETIIWVKWILHLRGASLAKVSSGVGSSGFPSPAPEGRDRIWQIQEVGGQVLTSATINHTHYSTVLRNRIK